MATGWRQVGGSWYLFSGPGAMLTGWQCASGIWCWLGSSGAMATSARVDGYWVGADGKWVPGA